MAARVADIVRTRVHNPEAIVEAAKRRVPASSVVGEHGRDVPAHSGRRPAPALAAGSLLHPTA